MPQSTIADRAEFVYGDVILTIDYNLELFQIVAAGASYEAVDFDLAIEKAETLGFLDDPEEARYENGNFHVPLYFDELDEIDDVDGRLAHYARRMEEGLAWRA